MVGRQGREVLTGTILFFLVPRGQCQTGSVCIYIEMMKINNTDVGRAGGGNKMRWGGNLVG